MSLNGLVVLICWDGLKVCWFVLVGTVSGIRERNTKTSLRLVEILVAKKRRAPN